MKILLLNPPGTRRYLRDYCCSHVSKGRYVWHPIDLLCLSGHLIGTHDLLVIDAIAEEMSPVRVRRAISLYEPDVIIFLTGSVSWLEDSEFIAWLSIPPHVHVCGMGDTAVFAPSLTFSLFPRLDSLLFDFIGPTVHSMLDSKDAGRGYFLRTGGIGTTIQQFPMTTPWSLPLPAYGLFPEKRYHLTHCHYHPFASVLTDFGCPFTCTFCPYENLPYHSRERENCLAELSYHHERGIREIWFKDQSFGSNRKHTRLLLEEMVRRGLRFSWSCETRAEFCLPETLELWRYAGCHTVMIGVESADYSVRARHRKPVTDIVIDRALRECKRVGIRTLLHFIVGLPGETTASLTDLPAFAASRDCDFATFNMATPEYGTTLRLQAQADGWLGSDLVQLDSSCTPPAHTIHGFNADELWCLRNNALRAFYLTPRRILRHLRKTRTAYQWSNLLREGFSLLISRQNQDR